MDSSGELQARRRVYLFLTAIIQTLLTVAMVWFVWRGDWENVFLTASVMALTMLPALLSKRFQIFVPPEFQLIAAAFVFLSLFLGSAADLYYKYWWWDAVLHTGSGFLLGIVGFLALFVLNETDKMPDGLKPGFLCFFAVTFAVTLGVLWEVFEFTVDSIWPSVNMQSNETGVVDTMEDLIVDTLGAIAVALMGWRYLKTGRYSFIADALISFMRGNPALFGAKGRKKASRQLGGGR